MKLKSEALKERNKVSRPLKAFTVPLDRSIVSACRYTKHSQELLEHAIGTCPQGSQPRAKQVAHTPLIRKKQVSVAQPSNKLDNATHRHVVTVKPKKTNVPVPPSTGLNSCPNASGSQPKSHVKLNRISPAKGDYKPPVDDQPRKNKSHLRTLNRIDSSSRLKRTVINSHSNSICQTCNKCLTPFDHDLYVATCLQSAMATPSIRHNNSVERKMKQVWKPKQVRQVWKPTGKVLTTIGYQWRPTDRIFSLGNQYKRNLSRHTNGKKRATLILIPSIRFTKLIIHHLQRRHRFHPRPDSPLYLSSEEPVLGYLKFSAKGTKREVFGMSIPDNLITTEIRQVTYYREYLAKVTHHRNYLAGETGGVQNPPAPKPTQSSRKPKAPTRPSISIPVASTRPAPTSAPAKSQEYKPKRFKRSISRKTRQPRSSPKSMGASEAEEVSAKEPQVINEDADYLKALEESMKDAYALPRGPLPPVVIREPESGKYQPLLEVPKKGKAKVTEEQVAHDLLSLQKHRKTSHADQYIFQRRVSEPTASSFHDESLYDVLGQSDSEEESEKIILRAEKGGQVEGQAGPDPDAQAEDQTGSDSSAQAEGQAGSNPDETSEGQAGSNPEETCEGQARPDPGNAEARVQSTSSPVVYAGSDREHMD
nr:integrase, catalytic region, zinc finger, CCHC-type, peptidase aspartic, catalytic [Tanacetum cinerariifolium]